MEKKKFGFVNTGASFLLVIFTVLCLVTFATLSVVSANADKKKYTGNNKKSNSDWL